MKYELIKKWWFLVVPVCGALLGGAAWAAKQTSNDEKHSLAIKRVEMTIEKRLDSMERKIDRVIDHLINKGSD